MNDIEAMLLAYHHGHRRRLWLVSLILLLVLAALAADVFTGAAGLAPMSVLHALFGGRRLDPTTLVIVQQIRLPQALGAVLIGVFLSLSGAQLQTVFDNPLAEGFTLGVAPAAAFGAALAIVLNLGLPMVPAGWMVSANAFFLALFATLLLLGMTHAAGGGARSLMLLGIGLVFTFSALTAFLQFTASQIALQAFTFWMLGSLSGVHWSTLGPLAIIACLLIPWSLSAAPDLTTLRLGEERARSLGLDIRRVRLMALLRVSLMTGASVASVGNIGFVGLVGPHIARLIVGEDHRIFLPTSALTGALVMLLAVLVGKFLLPGADLPTGITTTLIGLPVFFMLILARRAS